MLKELLTKDVIVFDVGNVLVRFDPLYISKKAFGERKYAQLHKGVFQSGLWGLIDTGLISLERLAQLMYEASHSDDPKDYEAILTLLNDFPKYECPLIASTWLKPLKDMGKKLYFLTNYHDVGFQKTVERFDFFKYFDGGVVSAEENVIKPAPRIFEILTERYGFSPQDALFIDDNEENVLSAKACGFSIVHYTQGPLEKGI